MTIVDGPTPSPSVGADDRPGPAECLMCFVLRRIESAGCDNTLRWAVTYRDAVVPVDRGLERRLQARGGFCDCEILANVFVPSAADADADDEWPDDRPECAGVRHGSTVPCRHWVGAS